MDKGKRSAQEANGIPPHEERTKEVTKEAQNKKDAPQQMPSLRERIRKSSPKLHRDKQTRSHPSFNQEREKEEFLTLTSLFF